MHSDIASSSLRALDAVALATNVTVFMERDTSYSIDGLKAIDVVHSLVPPHLVYESGDCGGIFFQDLLLQFHAGGVLPKAVRLTVVPGPNARGLFPDNLIP